MAATEPMERLPFFVYGTLRPGGRHYAWALRGRTVREESARMAGLVLYEGPGYPYAIEVGPDREAGDPQPAPEAGAHGQAHGQAPGQARAWVHGDLVYPTDAAYPAVVRALDELEEYRPGRADSLYERVVRPARRGDGGSVRAWVYLAGAHLASRLRAAGTVVPGGDWQRHQVRLGASFRSSRAG